MIAPNDEVRTAVVLAHQRVEDGLARTGVAHGGRQYPEYDAIGQVVILQQHFITAHTHISGDIITFGIADHL